MDLLALPQSILNNCLSCLCSFGSYLKRPKQGQPESQIMTAFSVRQHDSMNFSIYQVEVRPHFFDDESRFHQTKFNARLHYDILPS